MLTPLTLMERIIVAVVFAFFGLIIAYYSGCLPQGICRLLKIKCNIKQWCPYFKWRKPPN